MKRKVDSEEKMNFELKYCERCGGLWLRPAGGGQIYCVRCARQIAEMPPPTAQLECSWAEEGESDNGVDEIDGLYGEEIYEEWAGGEL